MPTHAETPLVVLYKLLCSRSCLPSWPWGSIQTSAGGQADPCLFSASSTLATSSQLVLKRWNDERWKGWTSNRKRCLVLFFLWGEIFNLKLTFYRAFSRSNMSSNSIQHLRSNLCTVPTFGVEITAMDSFGATCSKQASNMIGPWPAGMLLCICMALDCTDTSSSLVFNFRSLKSRWNWWNHARNNARGPGVFFYS